MDFSENRVDFAWTSQKIVMPGANCSIYGCNTNRSKKEIGIFKLPKARTEIYKKWRENWLEVITRTRVVDADLKRQIDNDSLHVCERHFKEEDIEKCRPFIFIIIYEVKNKIVL